MQEKLLKDSYSPAILSFGFSSASGSGLALPAP